MSEFRLGTLQSGLACSETQMLLPRCVHMIFILFKPILKECLLGTGLNFLLIIVPKGRGYERYILDLCHLPWCSIDATIIGHGAFSTLEIAL